MGKPIRRSNRIKRSLCAATATAAGAMVLSGGPLRGATVDSTWNVNGAGSWSSAGNWTAGVPNGVGHAARFRNASAGNATITQDVAGLKLGTIEFDNIGNYTLFGGNAITLDATSGNAAINVVKSGLVGGHVIASGLVLADSVDLAQNSSGEFTISGAISGSGAINKSGTGRLVLTGSANSFTGGVNISGGDLLVHNQNAIGSGVVTFAGGRVIAGQLSNRVPSITLPNNINLSGTGTIQAFVDTTFAGTVQGSGGLLLDAQDKTIVFAGNSANTYSGNTTVTFGDVELAKPAGVNAIGGSKLSIVGSGAGIAATATVVNAEQINDAATVSVNSYGGLNLAASETVVTLEMSGGEVTIAPAATLKLTSGNFSYVIGAGFSASVSGGTLDLNGAAGTFNILGATSISSVISNGSLHKSGVGTLQLSGANTFNGFSMDSGRVLIGNNAALGIGPATFSNSGCVLAADLAPRSIANPITLAQSLSVSGDYDLTFGGSVGGSGGISKSGAGTLTLSGPIAYGGATQVSQGKMVLNASLTTTASVTVSTGATLQLAQLPATLVLRTGTVGGKVDLKDNLLILTNQGVGTFDGSTYTGVSGSIRTGRNGGAWNGNGIMTSAPTGTLYALGVATAAQAGRAGGTFGGVSVAAAHTLVMYTYAGDANLDGKLNVDDYGRIDSSIPLGIAGWYNGDFNYDGKINVDDYGIIDSNVGIQGMPFPSGGGLRGVTSVPEPLTGEGMLIGWATSFLRRHRRQQR